MDESQTYEVVEPEPYSETPTDAPAETVSVVSIDTDQFTELMTVQTAHVSTGFFTCALLCVFIGALLGFVFTRNWRV